MGSDLPSLASMAQHYNFNPRSPHGERQNAIKDLPAKEYFNPRSPHGERQVWNKGSKGASLFQSTLPAWGATGHSSASKRATSFQSTLPAWGATFRIDPFFAQVCISIHAPRMGSDCRRKNFLRWMLHFNPRSPHGERPVTRLLQKEQHHFNPRSPHGERRCAQTQPSATEKFQSTLPAWGATSPLMVLLLRLPLFQSTLPAWGATDWSVCEGWSNVIFQSTLPAWGATERREEF